MIAKTVKWDTIGRDKTLITKLLSYVVKKKIVAEDPQATQGERSYTRREIAPVLEAVQLPAGIADLASGLTDVNRDDLTHC